MTGNPDKMPPIPAAGLDHVSLAVPDLEAAIDFYRRTFGAEVSVPKDVPAQKIRMAYVYLANVKIELMEPTDHGSPIAKFLERHPDGGIHHFCLTTADAEDAAAKADAAGLRVLGDGAPAPGHHGKPLFFLHPKDTLGALMEIEQEDI